MPDHPATIAAGDLIALAAIIIGFGSTVIVFRIQREMTMGERGETVWLACSDYLILIAVGLCLFLVVLPLLATVTPCLLAVASSAGAAAMVLEAGYIPSILAHYRIGIGASRKGPRERCEPWECRLVIVSFVIAVAAGAWVLAKHF
jgi:hypothetical protein